MSNHRRRSHRDFAEMSGFEIELPSSPDPLADEAEDAEPNTSVLAPPSTTRRLLQSNASSRFSAIPGTSPRKRMFALDVGNEITPQTIFVTVEAGPDGKSITKASGGTSVRRRLFGSPTPQPSPHRRVRTTTTSVPLRGLTDDEAEPTPKRRRRSSGRPGTPAATSSKKKRATPTTRRSTPTTKRTNKAKGTPVASSDILQSETPAGVDRPTPKRRGRPPKRKSIGDPSEKDDPNSMQVLPRKKNHKSRISLGPDDMERLPPASSVEAEPLGERVDVSMSPNDPISDPLVAGDDGLGEQADEDDLWMGGMSDPPLPEQRRASAGRDEQTGVSEPDHISRDVHQPELEDQGPLPGESEDYPPMMEHDESDVGFHHGDTPGEAERHLADLTDPGGPPGESDDYAPMMEYEDRSEAGSQRSEHSIRTRGAPDQTVDPESFTMIGIESMPSFRASRGVPTSDPPEIGETTSFFINKTLDSLRQEIAESDDEEVDVLESRHQTPANEEQEIPETMNLSPRNRRQKSKSPAKQSLRYSSRSPRRAESVPGSAASVEPQDYPGSPMQAVQSRSADGSRSDAINPVADEDSFSDIPEEVLAAAESQEEWQPTKEASEKLTDWAASGVKEHTAENGQDYLHGSAHENARNRARSAQSTPSRSDRTQTDENATISQPSVSRSVQTSRVSDQAMHRVSPRSFRSRSDSNRLLTPDETTSSSNQSPPANHIAAEENQQPIASEDVGSSPPEITSFVEEADRPMLPSRRSSDTPANQRPDIRVEQVQEQYRPPHAQAAGLQYAQLGGPRPTLSPVVRIGRTLQNILSDPPSPSARGSVLGSPFKGSVRNSSPLDGAAVDEALQNGASPNLAQQSGDGQIESEVSEPRAQSPPKPWAMSFAPLSQIKNLVTQGAQLFTSPHVNSSQVLDDPFGPSSPTTDKGPENSRGSAFMDRIIQASREGSAYSTRTGRLAMGGDGEEMRHRPDLPSSVRSGAVRVGVVGLGKTPTSLSASVESISNNRGRQTEVSDGFGMYDDDADEPAREEQQHAVDKPIAHGSEQRQIDNARGSGEDGMQAEQDKMELDDAPADDQGSEDEDDIWAVEANRTASSPQALMPADETLNSFRKSELSIDWGTQSKNFFGNSRPGRSPAFRPGRTAREDPPDSLEDYSLVDLHSGTSTQPSAKRPTAEVQRQPKRMDLSDFFSSSPNFVERQRRAKDASLAKSAAQKSAQPVAHIASPEAASQFQNAGPLSQKPLASAGTLTSELPSPAAGASRETTRESTERAESASTPEQARRQQAGYTPGRERNDANLFESWSVSSRPPTEQPQSSDSLDGTPRRSTPQNLDSTSLQPPDVQPRPGRAASPSRSCLRSPLKPKTPGRVVEFTSSTLSATAPLQTLVASQNEILLAPTPNPLSPGPELAAKGKENLMPASSSLTLSSPRHKHLQRAQQQHQDLDSPLSQTQWSRKHWIFLDNLLQEYRRGSLEFQLRHSSAVMASPRKRPSSALLGKQVTSQGETMLLEQWHLDIVDAFKKEVGGWPEDALAKRLFALVVGEERRRLGLVPVRR